MSERLVVLARLSNSGETVQVGQFEPTLENARIIFGNWILTDLGLDDAVAPAELFPREVYYDSNSLGFDKDQTQTLENLEKLSIEDLQSYEKTSFTIEELVTPEFIERLLQANRSKMLIKKNSMAERRKQQKKFRAKLHPIAQAHAHFKKAFREAPCTIPSHKAGDVVINLGTILFMANGAVTTNFRLGMAETLCNTINRCEDLVALPGMCKDKNDVYATLLYKVSCAGRFCHGLPDLQKELEYSICANALIWVEAPLGLAVGLMGIGHQFKTSQFDKFADICIRNDFPPTPLDVNLWRAFQIIAATPDHAHTGKYFHYDKLFDNLARALDPASTKKFWHGSMVEICNRIEKWLFDLFFRASSVQNARFDHELLNQFALGITREAKSTRKFNTMGIITKDEGLQNAIDILPGFQGDFDGLNPICHEQDNEQVIEELSVLWHKWSAGTHGPLTTDAIATISRRQAKSLLFRNELLQIISSELATRSEGIATASPDEKSKLTAKIPSLIAKLQARIDAHDLKIKTLTNYLINLSTSKK